MQRLQRNSSNTYRPIDASYALYAKIYFIWDLTVAAHVL